MSSRFLNKINLTRTNFLKKNLEEDNSNFFEIILPLPYTNISVTKQRNVQMQMPR